MVSTQFDAACGDLMAEDLRDVCVAVANATGMSYRSIRGRGRAYKQAAARHMVYYILRELGYSTPQIGRAMYRDHSTVMSGSLRVRDNKPLKELADSILEELDI